MNIDDYLVILQARTSSSRLPGKVLSDLNGKPMIEWIIGRIKQIPEIRLVVATSTDRSDDDLALVVEKSGGDVFRGSLQDVNSRFVEIVKSIQPKNFIRITGDCPLVMPGLISEMILQFENTECDLLSNTNPPTFPDGLDVEIVSSKKFLEFSSGELTNEEREHVTLGLYARPERYVHLNYINDKNLSSMRWTVDYPEDLNFVKNVYSHNKDKELTFNMQDVMNLVESNRISDNLISGKFRNISLTEEQKLE